MTIFIKDDYKSLKTEFYGPALKIYLVILQPESARLTIYGKRGL
jgi:hypothetical protein